MSTVQGWRRIAAATALLAGVAAGALATQPHRQTAAFAIAIDAPGVYRVAREALASAGPLPAGRIETAGLALSNRGHAVPIWVDDGGDGTFDAGDAIELRGEPLAGETTYYSPFSRWNVYRLRLGTTGGRRLAAPPSRASGPGAALVHLEQQRLRVRFEAVPGGAEPEVWYWRKLTQVDASPFRLDLDLSDRDAASSVALRVGLQGWSRPSGPRGEGAAHQVNVSWNAAPAGAGEWDGQDATVVELVLEPGAVRAGVNELGLSIPKRPATPGGEARIDVALLDWIEVGYARAADAPAPPALPPAWIKPDQPSTWRTPDNRADYLLVVHPLLREAVEPLARFHREQGLGVEVMLVDDIYDEWSDGIEDPRAIRAFVDYARREWRPPAPRFVLLVGDASWDPYRTEGDDASYADWTYRPGEVVGFGKNASTPYAQATSLGRNLVPTLTVATYEGEAASDNGFVAVEGDDHLPDLAIGRFPASTPEEAAAMVAKTIRYATATATATGTPRDEGDWRRRILWIANENDSFQASSDRLAAELAARGMVGEKIYPRPEEPDNREHQAEIRRAFDSGQLLVHFVGHGGRYIWRTGAPDFKKNHDLFTLEDLDALLPTTRLPVVVSMTCYSAPFDHPTADSIGEKLIRLPASGAVAVFAASWRNGPSEVWSRALLDELTQPGATVGEAVMAAKRRVKYRLFVETYNLLGDPALRLALPRYTNAVRWTTASEVENFGYDVYRGESAEGPFARITSEPVLGAGTTDEPQSYRFVDDTIAPDREYFYYVESIALDGQRERFTPTFRASPKQGASPLDLRATAAAPTDPP